MSTSTSIIFVIIINDLQVTLKFASASFNGSLMMKQDNTI